MRLVPFKAEHLAAIRREGSESDWVTVGQAKHLEGVGAFTGLADGEVVFCAGVVELWKGRFLAWSYIGERAPRYWKSIHKTVKVFLQELPARRVELHVRAGFYGGRRWAERLGFEVECERLRAFFPDGSDAVAYVMVKGD